VLPAWPRENVDSWPFVAPGLIDVQINGRGGTWFCDPALTPDAVLDLLASYMPFGVARLCPTLITASFEALAAGLQAICQACERERWADRMVAGCHLEGPSISPEDGPRGAHPREHVRPPDGSEFEKLQAISGGRIRLVTLAPESPGACDFIARLTASGVVAALGHTAASTEQVAAAVAAGARLSTHLGNGAAAMLPRHPNFLWDQAAEPRLMASLITDGHHLPDNVIRCLFACKGPSRTIVTCDASGLAGCPPGRYSVGGTAVEILPTGRIVVAGQQYLAGSAADTAHCVFYAQRVLQLPLRQAIDLAHRNPCRLMGWEETRLERGCRADLFVFHPPAPGQEERPPILATICDGVVRHRAPEWNPVL
jgi:N-acetylglucosamine-6-phosphate deacetylase